MRRHSRCRGRRGRPVCEGFPNRAHAHLALVGDDEVAKIPPSTVVAASLARSLLKCDAGLTTHSSHIHSQVVSSPQARTPPERKRVPVTRDVNEYLASSVPNGIRLGLQHMDRALDDLVRPERRSRILLAAGTNGKGSTCAMATAAFRAAGYRDDALPDREVRWI